MSSQQKRVFGFLALGVFLCSVYLLATGSPWLLVELGRVPGLPMGNLITWAGFLALPVASLLIFHEFLGERTRPATTLRHLMIGLLLLGAAWGFVSYGLAGNWAFNFSGESEVFRGSVAAGNIFQLYSMFVAVLSLLTSAVVSGFSWASKPRAD